MSGDTETPSLAEALVSGPRVCDCEGATQADEDGCCVSCGLDHRAFETPTLTTEQARGLAAKWAWWQDGGGVDTERPESLAAHEGGAFWVRRLLEMRFPDTDREQLFTWVRAASERYTIPSGYKSLAADLGISEDEAAALCQDVWPS